MYLHFGNTPCDDVATDIATPTRSPERVSIALRILSHSCIVFTKRPWSNSNGVKGFE